MGSGTSMFFYHSLRACVPFILVSNNICFSCVELCYVVKFCCETMALSIYLVIYIEVILLCIVIIYTSILCTRYGIQLNLNIVAIVSL